MRINRTQEKVSSIGSQQLIGVLDLFIEEPDRLRQQFGAGLRCLWGHQ
jgi:hypothetical protein